ncbi:MAG: N(4)-(beta-N-acetylglucosaminyl)-L-asparaginase [Clostridia bacterium]|nr:N(4)-(beta-N-acetylglucosaminyl)-L-asparaginase [Clostridia bacterium]
MRAIIGTWKMSFAGVEEGLRMLKDGVCAGEAVVHAVKRVEDEPLFRSVGYGGLPGKDGHVTLDAAFMDGRTLRVGGVMSVENIQNPILAAYRLCGRKTNCLLAGRGAEEFAIRAGLPLRDMRTVESMNRWREAVAAQPDAAWEAYRGHDTVCVLALDDSGNMAAGTSTSGLFMKEPGRVGDTPLVGSGFYCDARFGAAAATGLGEDIMRGCLSYEAVAEMRRGMSPHEACRKALDALSARKKELEEESGSISLIALSPDGAIGAATTLPVFPFAAGSGTAAALYMVENASDGAIRAADEKKLKAVD